MAETSRFNVVMSAESLGRLVEALKREFTDPPQLRPMLVRRLGLQRRYEVFAHTDSYALNLFSLVQAAYDQKWIGELISAAIDERPASAVLLQFFHDGRGPVLEAGVVGSPIVDFAKVEAISRWVCRLQSPIRHLGTGTLIAPDLIITNGHVLSALQADGFPVKAAFCIFDHRGFGGGEVSSGRCVELDVAWTALRRGWNSREGMDDQERPAAEELDYAILRLREPVGNQPVGDPATSAVGAAPRGWMRLPDPAVGPMPQVPTGHLSIFQHPSNVSHVAQPLQISSGAVFPCPWPDLRVRYAASTLNGSSGSPCFSTAWEMVALHHAAEYPQPGTTAKFNQGIPLEPILKDLALRANDFTSQNSQLPWTFPPPASTPAAVQLGVSAPTLVSVPVPPGVSTTPLAISPLAATILGRPPRLYFVNRKVLRKHLELLVQGDTDCSIVAINGLPCCGKGHSRYLIEHAARLNPNIKLVYLDFPRYRDMDQVCRHLAGQMAVSDAAMADLEKTVLIDAADPARIGTKFTAWLAETTSKATPRIWWFIIDSLHPDNFPDPALREHLLDHWIEGIRSDNRFTQIVLFLLGEDVRPDLGFKTLPESLDFLRREELREFFRIQAKERGRQLSATDLESLVARAAPSGNDPLLSDEMLQLQNRLRQVIQGGVLA